MNYRYATLKDCPLLAILNGQLIRDEGHRNPMTVEELEERMRRWLKDEYKAVLFEDGGEIVAYALFTERKGDIYLRQFYVVPHRRRQGIGTTAMQALQSEVFPPGKRNTVEVLVGNHAAIGFWKHIGFHEYSLVMEMLPEDASTSETRTP